MLRDIRARHERLSHDASEAPAHRVVVLQEDVAATEDLAQHQRSHHRRASALSSGSLSWSTVNSASWPSGPVCRYEPHVALVDLFVGDETGGDICQRLRERLPMTHVLLMSGVGHLTSAATRAVGASGFVPKGWSMRDIAIAARMVGLGMTVFPPAPLQRGNKLSEGETEVLDLFAQGLTNATIADALISLRTPSRITCARFTESPRRRTAPRRSCARSA